MIYIISPVSNATEYQRIILENHVSDLEKLGNEVHLPHMDTNQSQSLLEICFENSIAIQEADEVHIFYDRNSSGSHFDLGVLFAFDMLIGKRKEIKFFNINDLQFSVGFNEMIQDWINEKE